MPPRSIHRHSEGDNPAALHTPYNQTLHKPESVAMTADIILTFSGWMDRGWLSSLGCFHVLSLPAATACQACCYLIFHDTRSIEATWLWTCTTCEMLPDEGPWNQIPVALLKGQTKQAEVGRSSGGSNLLQPILIHSLILMLSVQISQQRQRFVLF